MGSVGRFILLSERRSASTWLSEQLEKKFRMKHEKLSGWETSPDEFKNFLPSSFDDCDGWNLMCYQMGFDTHWVHLGDFCRNNDVAIIDLHRLDAKAQCLSLSKAMTTGVWNSRCLIEPTDTRYIPTTSEFTLYKEYQHLRKRRCLDPITFRMMDIVFEDIIDPRTGKLNELLEFIRLGTNNA